LRISLLLIAVVLVFVPRPAFAQGHDGHMRHCALPATAIAEVPMGAAVAQKSLDCPHHMATHCDMHDKTAFATCDMSRCGYTDGSSLPASLNDSGSGGQVPAMMPGIPMPAPFGFVGIVQLGQSTKIKIPHSPIPRPPSA